MPAATAVKHGFTVVCCADFQCAKGWQKLRLIGIFPLSKSHQAINIMLKKLDKLLIEKFPHIILAFTFFWLGLVAYGLIMS